MLFTGSVFAQNPLINGMWANAGGDGNLLESTKLSLIDIDGLGLYVLSGKYTLTQTGAQVQVILDGTFTGSPSLTLGANGGNSGQIDMYASDNDYYKIVALTNGLLEFTMKGIQFRAIGDEDRGTLNFGASGTASSSLILKDKNSATRFSVVTADVGGGSFLWDSGPVIFNETGYDADFRIESDSKPDAFSLDGATGTIGYDSLLVHRERSWVADDGEIVLATGVAGMGTVIIGDNTAWAYVTFTSAGAVTIEDSKGSVVNTDTDTNLCIYDAGSGIAIKNRLGSALTVMIDISYADPTP